MESTLIWDRDKARKNFGKHRILFKSTAEAFFDPFIRVVDASAEEEARDAIIGMDTRWSLLFVVHIVAEDERIRIISARKATRLERLSYEN